MSKRSRKIRDKWRLKDWYTIYSPSYFGGVALGSTPSEDQNRLLGRVIEATLYDLTGDFSQQHIKLYFQVVEVKESGLETIFKGHEYSRDYLRSLVRRGSTRVDCILDITTKEGYELRVSSVAFSLVRIKNSQIAAIRTIKRNVLKEKAKNLNFDQFVQEAVLGKIASDIYNEGKRIIPLRHVGIRKSKLMSCPKGVD